MRTALDLDAAERLIVDAFQPYGCVVSANPLDDSLGFSLVGLDGEEVWTVPQIERDEYSDPLKLKLTIEQTRQELERTGHRLERWQMPFITDPSILPPPAVN